MHERGAKSTQGHDFGKWEQLKKFEWDEGVGCKTFHKRDDMGKRERGRGRERERGRESGSGMYRNCETEESQEK